MPCRRTYKQQTSYGINDRALKREEAAGETGCSTLALNLVVIMFYAVLRDNRYHMTVEMEKLIAPLQCSPLHRSDKFQHSISQTLIWNRWTSAPSAGPQSCGGSGPCFHRSTLLLLGQKKTPNNTSWHFILQDWYFKCIPNARAGRETGSANSGRPSRSPWSAPSDRRETPSATGSVAGT